MTVKMDNKAQIDKHRYAPIVIVDIDNCISNDYHRNHHAVHKRWDRYHELCNLDPHDEHNLDIIRKRMDAYSNRSKSDRPVEMHFFTGRSEQYREMTMSWLRKHLRAMGFNMGNVVVVMRPEGNYLKACELKEGWLWAGKYVDTYAPHFKNILHAYDDSTSIINMYQSLDIPATLLAINGERE